jgi:hypothetical protein
MVSYTRSILTASVAVAFAMASANAEVISFDFGDGGGAIANGTATDSPGGPFNNTFTIGSSGPNLGSAVFDSNPVGPNAGARDQDLLINSTNILILQSQQAPGIAGGIFSSPNDTDLGGTLDFDFSPAGFAVEIQSIDIADIDDSSSLVFTLTDSFGRTRVITVPSEFTGDISDGEPGFATIDLLGGPQASPNNGALMTTVAQEAGFNALDIASLVASFEGSGALDNLTFVPEPATGLLLCGGLIALIRRRR